MDMQKKLDYEEYNNLQVRSRVEKILEESSQPVEQINELVEDERYSPSAFLNCSIPIIEAIQSKSVDSRIISDLEDFLDESNDTSKFYIAPYIPEDNSDEVKFLYQHPFNADKRFSSRYLWPDFSFIDSVYFFYEPMYFYLTDVESFKKELDYYLRGYTNKYAQYKLFFGLRQKANNSIEYLKNRIGDLEKWKPYLSSYRDHVLSALQKASDIKYVVEGYLTPLLPVPIDELKGNLKGMLPIWEKENKKLDELYTQLSGRFLDKKTQKEIFFKLFSGGDLSSFKHRISWIDVNPKNKVPTFASILKLFKILAYSEYIDIRYATNGGLVRDIAHTCFELENKPPRKKSMSAAWSSIDSSSKKYQDLKHIVENL